MDKMKQKKELTASEMGKIGGSKTRDKHGHDYYARIGAMGRAKHAPDFYQKINKLSVEARRKRKKEKQKAKEAEKSPFSTLTKALLGS